MATALGTDLRIERGLGTGALAEILSATGVMHSATSGDVAGRLGTSPSNAAVGVAGTRSKAPEVSSGELRNALVEPTADHDEALSMDLRCIEAAPPRARNRSQIEDAARKMSCCLTALRDA